MHIEVANILVALLYLIALFGMGGYFNKGYLTEALKDKMKYLRNAKPRPLKRPPSDNDEVRETGAEWKCDDGEQESLVKKPRKEFKQYPQLPTAPLFPPGEDRASYQRHLKMLQQEERKVSPDKRVISELMRRTYPFRRQEILEQPQLVVNLLQTYPSLKRSEQVQSRLLTNIQITKHWCLLG